MVIFIANEAEIKCKEYGTIKEKTIGQTCHLIPEVEAVLGEYKRPLDLEENLLFDEFKDVIEVRLKALGASADNITTCQMGNNLRLMKRCVDCFIQNIKTFKEFEPFIDVEPNPNGSQDDYESKTKERFRKTMLTIYCGLFFQKDVVSLSDALPSEGKGDNSTPDQANTRNRLVEVIVGGMGNILNNDPLGTKKSPQEILYGLNLEADWVGDLVNDRLYSLPFATVMAHLMFEPTHDYQTKIKEFNRRWHSRHTKLIYVHKIIEYIYILPPRITSDELKTKLNEALGELEQKSADLKALTKCGPIENDAQVDWLQVLHFYNDLLWLGKNVWFDKSKHEYLSNARDKVNSIAMELITIGGMTVVDIAHVFKKAGDIDENLNNFIKESINAQNNKLKDIDTLEELKKQLIELNKNHLVGDTIHIEKRLNITPVKCLKLFQNHVLELMDDSKKEPTNLIAEVINILARVSDDHFITNLKQAFSGWHNEEQDELMSYFIKNCLEPRRNRCAKEASTHG